MNIVYLGQELLHRTNKEVLQSNFPETSWIKQGDNVWIFTNFRNNTEDTQNIVTACKCV